MDQRISALPPPRPRGLERLGNAWQGLIDRDDPAQVAASAHWDKLLNTVMGPTTGCVSPAAVALAFTDWALQLWLSPSQRDMLVLEAWKRTLRWLALAQQPLAEECCIEPLPQDKRFAGPAWGRSPYRQTHRGNLLLHQWWHVGATGEPGIAQHHEHVFKVVMRQLLVITKPVAPEAKVRSGGQTLCEAPGTYVQQR